MGILYYPCYARFGGYKRRWECTEQPDRKRKSNTLGISLKKEQAQRALTSLEELVSKYSEKKDDVILRDALIQRFEYSTEAFWKYLKAYLQTEHNLSANSPREVIRTGLFAKLYSEEISQELLQMLDDRNLTSHTYVEELAESIAHRIPEYSKNMNAVMTQLSYS